MVKLTTRPNEIPFAHNRLETLISDIEFHFTRIGIIPILGTITGTLHVVFGIFQSISALFLTVLLTVPACANQNCYFMLRRSVVHIIHGIGNIGPGILELIPIIGTLVGSYKLLDGLYSGKSYSFGDAYPQGDIIRKNRFRQSTKFLYYPSLTDPHSAQYYKYAYPI